MRGPPTVSASLAARPSITKTPTHEPPWSWKPVSRDSHQVLSHASLCSLRQSSSNEPAPSRGSAVASMRAGRGARQIGALLGAERAARVGEIVVARRHRATIAEARRYARKLSRGAPWNRSRCTAATSCGSRPGACRARGCARRSTRPTCRTRWSTTPSRAEPARRAASRPPARTMLPVIEFADGRTYREESKDMAARIAAGKLVEG